LVLDEEAMAADLSSEDVVVVDRCCA